MVTVLILVALGVGLLIYFLGKFFTSRTTERFVGGENLLDYQSMRVSGTEFYATIQDIPVLKALYFLAERKLFDIYEVGVKLTFGFNAVLRYLHNGVLSSYLTWCLLGTLILLLIFFN